MNCQHFEGIVGDLARNLPLEARAREQATGHAEACARCAARLSDERALSAGLRGLAASALPAEAPPRVEAALLAAFRAQAAQSPAARVASEKVVPLARPSAVRPWSWAKTAAAAGAAAAAVVALFVLVAPPRPEPTGVAASRPAAAPTAGEQTQAAVPPTNTPPPAAVRPDAPTPEVAGVAPRFTQPPRVQPAHNLSRAASPASYRSPRGAAARDAGRFADREEIATDFIPLTQDARFAVEEGGGQVVRVELPRTALQRFGLPMNVEQTGGRVKADLMLGYDGIPRAIRFVR